jgi:hypothetical protein
VAQRCRRADDGRLETRAYRRGRRAKRRRTPGLSGAESPPMVRYLGRRVDASHPAGPSGEGDRGCKPDRVDGRARHGVYRRITPLAGVLASDGCHSRPVPPAWTVVRATGFANTSLLAR